MPIRIKHHLPPACCGRPMRPSVPLCFHAKPPAKVKYTKSLWHCHCHYSKLDGFSNVFLDIYIYTLKCIRQLIFPLFLHLCFHWYIRFYSYLSYSSYEGFSSKWLGSLSRSLHGRSSLFFWQCSTATAPFKEGYDGFST